MRRKLYLENNNNNNSNNNNSKLNPFFVILIIVIAINLIGFVFRVLVDTLKISLIVFAVYFIYKTFIKKD